MATQSKREMLIEKNMKALNISYEEARDLVIDDEAIDRGERLEWEPSVEEEKAMRKATKLAVDRKPRAKSEKKEKEADETKREIVSKLAEALGCYEGVEIENVERVVKFSIDGENYSVTLTKHRTEKA